MLMGNMGLYRNGATFGSSSIFTDSVFAFSLRTPAGCTYNGPLIRVRRSSDNSELNIFALSTLDINGNRVLDTVSLLSFVGAGSGFVTTWYDQSGNNRNATQTDSTRQPRIVNAGVLETMNGRPQMFFDGVNDRFDILNLAGLYTTAFYHSAVVRLNNYATGNNDVIGNFNNNRFAVANIALIGVNSTAYYFSGLGSTGPHVLGGYAYMVSQGGVCGFRQNGANNGSPISLSLTTLNNISTLNIASNSIAHANSNQQELISFNRPLSDSSRSILEANQINFYLVAGQIN